MKRWEKEFPENINAFIQINLKKCRTTQRTLITMQRW